VFYFITLILSFVMKKITFLFHLTGTQLFIGKLTLAAIAILSATAQISAQTNDTVPPEVVDFSLSSSVIDTTNDAQNVVVSVRATDNNTGVNLIEVRFQSPSGNQFVTAFLNGQQRISGDNRDGVYSATVTFPRYSKAGTWSVLEIIAHDAANNYKTINTNEIASLGFAAGLQVISNDEDTTPPEINDFSFTPSAVDTVNGSQTVTVTVRVTDAKIGVRNVSAGFQLRGDDIVYGVNMNRISGDDKDGVYQGVTTFNQRDASGMYEASVYASDALGNSKSLGKPELAERGFATELQVISSSPASQPAQKSRKRVRFF
jgi:hypothetical protein